ncbi:regulator of G protein signaling superfamily [Colletotrichum tofieldiae]|uniref:Regulator of G protein signaling superfamily n=1 Tax=Colletotrichum tofieldiae TaxID=708197 RepID=A0A166XDH5_9PEZI|nr:regulator of G protein signaling superfamily [Colletotrichum tofieldiae]GKT95270.1 regulator of G protein signaling superfamily [Colletotrichum tofieldiae]
MGLLPLTYRRPVYVTNSAGESSSDVSDSGDEKQSTTSSSLRSGKSGTPQGIPESLAFDKIINGGTCPPCTVRDFMNYLIYIEHAAENLQFFLWHQDYRKRFGETKTSDMSLAPEWTEAMETEVLQRMFKEKSQRMRKKPGQEIFKGTDFEKKGAVAAIIEESNSNPFSTPPRTPNDQESVYTGSHGASNADSYRSQASDAFAAIGAKQPFTIQPFREEIDRVIATYIMEGAPRQLNLSAKERDATLHALAYTTHPSACRLAIKVIENSLRQQAHPNFIRWSICNGNPARVFFARALGVGLIAIAFVAAILITLSHAGRGWRALAAIGWVLGISTLVAAYKGMCVVLHGMHHRHVRPWELFVDEENEDERSKTSFESFGSTNSYESEPWIIKYEKRNIVRKVFDREVWIEEPALRTIQDTIFLQAMLCAVLVGGIFTAIFVAIPKHGYF